MIRTLLSPFCWAVSSLLRLLHSAAELAFDPDSGACWVVTVVSLLIVVRLLLLPLAYHQAKAFQKLSTLAPLLAAAKADHAGDPEKVAAATVKVYKEAGASPAGGFLPFLVQVPVISALYYVLNQVIIHNNPHFGLSAGLVSSARHADLCGASLASAFLTAPGNIVALGGDVSATRTLAMVLAGVVMLTTLVSSLISFRQMAKSLKSRAVRVGLVALSLFGVGTIAGALPVMVSLYLAATSIWALVQSQWLRRRFPSAAAAAAAPLV